MNYAFLGSDNDWSPVRNRVIVWTNAELLSIPRGLYFNGIFIYSFMWENDFEIDVREISATLSRLQCAMKSIMYFWGQPSEWYPFGSCRKIYKMMLNSMHCHHIVGLEISAKALMPLSQIPPECARSYCMPFHTSRSTLSCNIWKQTNKHINKNNVVIEANRQTSYLLSMAALLAAVADITVDYGTVRVIFIQKKGFNARRESLYTVGWLFLSKYCGSELIALGRKIRSL